MVFDSDTYIPSKDGDSSSFISSPLEQNKGVAPSENPAQTSFFVPIGIFNCGLSGLEALSAYLKNEKGMRFCQIASLLNRDDRTIWDSYSDARSKMNSGFPILSENHLIPLSIFSNRQLGVLEAISTYLKEEKAMRYCDIASLLGKNDRTIWTAHSRAKKKRAASHAS